MQQYAMRAAEKYLNRDGARHEAAQREYFHAETDSEISRGRDLGVGARRHRRQGVDRHFRQLTAAVVRVPPEQGRINRETRLRTRRARRFGGDNRLRIEPGRTPQSR